MHVRPIPPPLRHALAAVLLLGAAACADQPTTPATPGTVEVRRTTADGAATLSKPVLHPNRRRYRHEGERPATGRSGSASLSMLALVGRDGKTEVELSTGNVDEPWGYTPGTIVHAQTKASSPDGKHMFTRTDNKVGSGGRATLVYGGLARGSVLQVQANVRDIDPNRTDVVTVTGPVLRRPNLAVTSVSAPERGVAGSVINVAATIRETNGDMGNWGNCMLYENGVRVDWAYGIWVDAGGSVTCAFAYTLRGAAPVRLEVRVEEPYGTLRDDNPGDNAAEIVVESFTTNEIYYSLSALDDHLRDSSFTYHRWRRGPAEHEMRFEQVRDIRHQVVRLYGYMPRGLSTNPFRLEIAESTGGTQITSATYELAPGDVQEDGSFCTGGQDAHTGAYLFLCSSTLWGGWTGFNYERYAGDVTYHSHHYSRTWDGTTGEEYVYTENFSSVFGIDPIPVFQRDFAMRVRLYDGEEVFSADPVATLDLSETDYAYPYSCASSEYPAEEYSSEYCSSWIFRLRTVLGSSEG